MLPLTVALLTFNRALLLTKSIEAILAQTYQDFELLILDNCSSDSTPSIILALSDSRIRYVRNAPGQGSAFNGASAMRIARGRRLIITHDDDLMEIQLLEKQMRVMDENPNVIAVWSNVSVIDESGRFISRNQDLSIEDRLLQIDEFVAFHVKTGLHPTPSALMIDMVRAPLALFGKNIYFGLTGKHKTHGGDDILNMAILNKRGSIYYIAEPLLRYRKHINQDTNDVDISKPVLASYKAIYCLFSRQKIEGQQNSYNNKTLVRSVVARYEAQNIITKCQKKRLAPRNFEKLKNLFLETINQPELTHSELLPIIPIMIFLNDFRMIIAFKYYFPNELDTSSLKSSDLALLLWLKLKQRHVNLFDDFMETPGIFILGSAFIAALLVKESQDLGLNVECIDSKRSRQGQKILGVNIRSPEVIEKLTGKDCIILSSEREQDDYLTSFIKSINSEVKVVSWKKVIGNYSTD